MVKTNKTKFQENIFQHFKIILFRKLLVANDLCSVSIVPRHFATWQAGLAVTRAAVYVSYMITANWGAAQSVQVLALVYTGWGGGGWEGGCWESSYLITNLIYRRARVFYTSLKWVSLLTTCSSLITCYLLHTSSLVSAACPPSLHITYVLHGLSSVLLILL